MNHFRASVDCLFTLNTREETGSIFLIHIHKRYCVPRICVGDSHNFLLFYISGSEKINIFGCKNILCGAHWLGKTRKIASTSHFSLGRAGRAPWRRFWRPAPQYPESLPVHSPAYQDPATEDWEASPGLLWPPAQAVFLYTRAFCSLARRLRQCRGGGGACECRSEWASQFVLRTQAAARISWPRERPTRSFLCWIHYTHYTPKCFCPYLDIGLWQKSILHVIIQQIEKVVWHLDCIALSTQITI